MNMDAYAKTYAIIPEWLCLIDNDKYVVTNSFHCCVFSIWFEKQFGVISLTGKYPGMNSRLQSLFEMTGCEVRYIKDSDFSVLGTNFTLKNIVLQTVVNI